MKISLSSNLLIALLAAAIPAAAAAAMYQWTDENGVKHWTDTAPPDHIQDAETMPEENPGQAEKKSVVEDEADQDGGNRDGDSAPNHLRKARARETQSAAKKENRKSAQAGIQPHEYHWQEPKVSGDDVEVTGRIEWGEPCDVLLLKISLQDEDGYPIYMTCPVKDVGDGRRAFVNCRHRNYTGSKKWSITKVREASCTN